MKTAPLLVRMGAIVLLLGLRPVLALDQSLDVSQYAHTSWTVKDGFALGNIVLCRARHAKRPAAIRN